MFFISVSYYYMGTKITSIPSNVKYWQNLPFCSWAVVFNNLVTTKNSQPSTNWWSWFFEYEIICFAKTKCWCLNTGVRDRMMSCHSSRVDLFQKASIIKQTSITSWIRNVRKSWDATQTRWPTRSIETGPFQWQSKQESVSAVFTWKSNQSALKGAV